MKKLLLTLIVALGMCGSSFAQYTSNWPDFNGNYYPFQGAIVATIMINGEIINVDADNWNALEVAAFVGEECRGNDMYMVDDYVIEYGDPYPVLDGNPIYYNNGGEEVSFMMYDHMNEVLYETCEILYMGEPLTILTGEEHTEGWGDPENPIFLNFTQATTGFEKEILAYDTELNNHWYFIASPVGEVSPTAVTLLGAEGNMLNENGYDLFSFDQSQNGAEWRNYAQTEFMLEPGKGYLYANHDDVTLVFNGTAYTGTGTFDLVYNADANATGFNLVGNPFGDVAYVDRPFYTMNEGGTDIMTESTTGTVPAMNGIFVQATEEGSTVTFSTEAPGDKSASLALNLSSGRNVIDRAIVRFDEGLQLNKFQLNPNSTKVYIPVDNEDFAVVRGESMGEMPVNFKAESNGNYTLSFTNENVEFAYLHLIDNMNGNDVDLLANPTYSFDALTTDYASRFKLVFATGNADDDFAFFSNGNFIINNEGNAMLQVVDVTGRILKSETINGCASVNVNAAPGVYMLRLINGDNMKVQKVVVK